MLSDFCKRLFRRLGWHEDRLGPPDLSELAKLGSELPSVPRSFAGLEGPALAFLGDPRLTLAPIDVEKDWEALDPDSAWRILKHRRAGELFPHRPCEFDVYLDLLRRSGPQHQTQLFIGLRTTNRPRPVLIPRYVCGRHSYILGGTGSGKTAFAVAQLLVQLSSHYVDEHGRREDSPPIVIFDMKFNGDKYLKSIAEKIAAARGQKLRFFSNNPDFQSLKFDPMFCFRSVQYPLKMVESWMKALSIVFPEGYGSTFFSNEQRLVFMDIVKQQRPDSFDRLVELVRKATHGRNGNKDARGLYAALAALKMAEHCHTDNSPLADDERIDFDRLFEKREVLYIHLDTRGLPMTSKDIGRLLLYALAETAAQREQQGRKVQSFVVLDEFQRLAARNIVEMAEDARQSGLGFIFSHQTPQSLLTNDNEDLFGILFANCGLIQVLSLKDERTVELLRLISGRKIEIRKSGSIAITETTSGSAGSSSTSSLNSNGSSSESRGSTYASAKSTAVTHSDGWREEMVPGLIPDMLPDLHSHKLRCIIQVNAPDVDMMTPLGGKPTLVQGLFPFSSDDAKAMAAQSWPRNPERGEAYFYPKMRMQSGSPPSPLPPVGGKGINTSQGPTLRVPPIPPTSTPTQETTAPAPSAESPVPGTAGDPSQRTARLKRVCDRLAQHMLQTKKPG